jgi:hypothetical protein
MLERNPLPRTNKPAPRQPPNSETQCALPFGRAGSGRREAEGGGQGGSRLAALRCFVPHGTGGRQEGAQGRARGGRVRKRRALGLGAGARSGLVGRGASVRSLVPRRGTGPAGGARQRRRGHKTQPARRHGAQAYQGLRPICCSHLILFQSGGGGEEAGRGSHGAMRCGERGRRARGWPPAVQPEDGLPRARPRRSLPHPHPAAAPMSFHLSAPDTMPPLVLRGRTGGVGARVGGVFGSPHHLHPSPPLPTSCCGRTAPSITTTKAHSGLLSFQHQ